MICAVADRIQDADRWLNGRLEFPKDWQSPIGL